MPPSRSEFQSHQPETALTEGIRIFSATEAPADLLRGATLSQQTSIRNTGKEKGVIATQHAIGADEDNGKSPAYLVEDEFPDGGLRAWMVVCGTMCSAFATFGYANSWGIFQGYYTETLLSHQSPSSMPWIGSIQYALVFLPGLITGRLFDMGYTHSIFIPASLLIVVATFIVAECKEYYQFLLCQGLAVGLGCGGLFTPTAAVISHWFKRRRGLAMGMVAVGSGVGGTILPITAKNLIPAVGFKWTMRIFGFILLFVLGLCNLLLKRRLPPRSVTGGIINLSAFNSAPYATYCASAFIIFLGVYTLLTYVAVSATTIGISGNFAFYFIAIANASSLVGRYCAGFMSDRVGSMNIMVPFTASAGILTYAWPFAKSEAALIAVTLIYGFCSGAYVSLNVNPILEMGDTGDVGRRIGMFMSIMALGALAGPPISGAIAGATGNFRAVGYYAGTCVLVGVGVMCFTRYLILKRMVGKI